MIREMRARYDAAWARRDWAEMFLLMKVMGHD